LGLFASAFVGASAFMFVVFPEARSVVTVEYYGGPIFLFELVVGLWLVFKGIRPPAVAAPSALELA
jgi:hypothetical protein